MDNNRPTFGICILIAAVVFSIALCIKEIAVGNLTDRESLLLSVVLTFLSLAASWITAHYYAQFNSNRNLRVFALKAAEKVTNLSSELDRLTVFLQQELENDEYESPAQSLLARDVRIEGAIHVLSTLKSVNDRSLSDWQGVIGDEITARQKKQEEREEDLRMLVDRLESLYETDTASTATEQHESTAALRGEIESLKSDLRLVASMVSGVPARRKRALPSMEQLETQCPRCSTPLQYRQRQKQNGYKSLKCLHCDTNLLSRCIDGAFIVEERTPISENVSCPVCSSNLTIQLDPMPGSAIVSECNACNSQMRVYRTPASIGIKAVDVSPNIPMAPITEEFLRAVMEEMPEQPWPKGAARGVAAKLQAAPKSVARAIAELMRRGVYKRQIDGQLYIPENNQE